MPAISTKVIVRCDICGDEMQLQHDESYVCWRDQHRIPADQLYRYAEHITVKNDHEQCGECETWQESGFINDHGWCMDCEEAHDVNQI